MSFPKRKLTLGLAALTASCGLAASLAFAAPANAGHEGKVTICHHTGSAKNPIVIITVDRSALPAHEGHGDELYVDGQCGGGGGSL